MQFNGFPGRRGAEKVDDRVQSPDSKCLLNKIQHHVTFLLGYLRLLGCVASLEMVALCPVSLRSKGLFNCLSIFVPKKRDLSPLALKVYYGLCWVLTGVWKF